MCEPTTILMGLSIATAAAGAVAQADTAKQRQRSVNEQADARAEEINAQKTIEAGERVKQARAERARLRVAAGEAGIGGVSFEDQLFDSFLQEDLDLGNLAKDKEFQLRATEANRRSGLAQSQGPSALETGLNIAGAGYAGYSAGLQIKDTRKRVESPGSR